PPPHPHSFPTRRSSDLRHSGAAESRFLESAVVARNPESFRVLGRSVRARLAVVEREPPAICVIRHPEPTSRLRMTALLIALVSRDRKSTRLNSSHSQIS